MKKIIKPSFAAPRALAVRVVIGLMIGMTILACAPRPSPVPQGSDTYWYGNIVSGGKFGVQVGEEYSSAKRILIGEGFHPIQFYSEELISCSENNGVTFECSPPQQFTQFRLKQFAKSGSVFLIVDEGRVVRIAWSFALFQLP